MFKVLLVEDNVWLRQTFKDMLSMRFPSFSIEAAGDGKEAMQKVDASVPDLIFMDVKLPGENGIKLTKRIKSSHPEVTIVVLTSCDLPEYREYAYRSGANHFIAKGTSGSDEIAALVESIMSGRKPSENGENKDSPNVH